MRTQAIETTTAGIGCIYAVLLTVAFVTGCPANTSQLQKAATASQQAMIVVQGFQQGEILAYNRGKACAASGVPSGCILIPDEDHLIIQQSVQAIAEIDKTVNTCIGGAGTSIAAVDCANSAITQIQQLQNDGDLHLKSATAKQDFDIAMIGARIALSVIVTILGGK